LWAEAFWKPSKGRHELVDQFIYYNELRTEKRMILVFPILMLTAMSLYIGLGAENIIVLSKRIAFELMHSEVYIEAVFKGLN